jgi:hypothetical protein
LQLVYFLAVSCCDESRTFHRQVVMACPVHLNATSKLLRLPADGGLQLLWGGAHSMSSMLVDDGLATLGNGANAKPAGGI